MKQSNGLNGKHVVITGGSSGIGLATAREARRRGALVSIIARNEERLAAALLELNVSEPGASAHPVISASADVSNREQITGAIADVVQRQSHACDVLICCAGIAVPGYFGELTEDVFTETMAIDYFGVLWSIRAVAPSMVEQGSGAIVGVSSVAGLLGVFGYSAYSPAKFAVRGLLEVLRAELVPHGIAVHCACPPDVDTPQLAAENLVKPPETAAISGEDNPISPEKVAGHILDGIGRKSFLILDDTRSGLIARLVGLFPRTFHSSMDKTARKAS